MNSLLKNKAFCKHEYGFLRGRATYLKASAKHG